MTQTQRLERNGDLQQSGMKLGHEWNGPGEGTWRIIPLSKWLVTIVHSDRFRPQRPGGYSLSKWPTSFMACPSLPKSSEYLVRIGVWAP